jgi:hypothetical protein
MFALAIAAIAATTSSASAFTWTQDTSGTLYNYKYYLNSNHDAFVRCNANRTVVIGMASTMAFETESVGPLFLSETVYVWHWELANGTYRWVNRADYTVNQTQSFDSGYWGSFTNDATLALDKPGSWTVTVSLFWKKWGLSGNYSASGYDTFSVNQSVDYTGPARTNGGYCYFSA